VIRVQCLTGGEAVYIRPGDPSQHAHERLNAVCTHCADSHPQDHPHGETGSACPRTHDGPCWNPGPGPGQVRERPPGCTVCRPVLIELMPGAAPVSGA